MKSIEIINPTAQSAPVSISERVKTFEDACNVLGITGEVFTGQTHEALKDDCKAIEAFTKLVIITRALNEGWKPNWENSRESKYYPWFKMEGGFGLDYVYYRCTDSAVGSRLCFKSEALTEYAAKQFLSIYKDFFTL